MPFEPQEHLIRVERTARFHTIGIPGPHIRYVWFVLHGYGQLSKYFIRHFQNMAEDDTLIVAPEGLSLFYIPPGWARVGATWMTKEKRASEIDDYVRFLDQVYMEIAGQVPEDARITVLGFSQGATTAWRWAQAGGIKPEHFINWAGSVPDEHIAVDPTWERSTQFYYVQASEDEYINEEQALRTIEILKAKTGRLEVFKFDGDHRMDEPTLMQILPFTRS